ncbi:MAG: FAD/NAD(P)-binding oxidoreductase [bacterium]
MSASNREFDADVAVIGAGPAGIAAATRAAEAGARVVIVDESPNVGGQIWRHRPGAAAPTGAIRWLARLERSGARVLAESTVFDLHRDDRDGFVVAFERAGAPGELRARALVLATGARERFLPFPGWTIPGVIGVGGAQALLKAGASVRGKTIVIAGSGPLLLPVAASLVHAGAHLALVAEQAPARRVASFAVGLWRRPAALRDAVRYRAGFLRVPYRLGEWVTEARGASVLTSVVMTDGRSSRAIPCDLLCVGFGLVPNTELPRHVGCSIADGVVRVDDRQATSVQGVFCAGEPTGIGGVDLALVEGEIAGLCAAEQGGAASSPLRARRARLRRLAAEMDRAFALRDELRRLPTAETIVCRCEDVAYGALYRDWSPRQAKLYARAGMGACQGRVCGPALEFLLGWDGDAVIRAPVTPTLLGAMCGREGDAPSVARVPSQPGNRNAPMRDE